LYSGQSNEGLSGGGGVDPVGFGFNAEYLFLVIIRYTIGSIPAVLKIRIAINQTNCLSCAARQRAKPFRISSTIASARSI